MESFIQSVSQAFAKHDSELAAKQNEAKNVALVQELYQSIAEGDLDALSSLLHESIEAELFGPENAFSGKATGIPSFLRMVQDNFSQLESQQPEIQEVVSQGNLVTVVGRETGKLKNAEADYRLRWVQLFRYENGRLIEFRQVSQFE